MRPSLQQRVEQENDKGIDLSPLLDVVFIMLIFFIVTTVFVNETGVEVDKPQAVTTTQLERTVIMIAITAAGEVVYDGANIGAVGVRATVAQLLRTQPDRPVVVQADEEVPTGLLVQVIDEAKLAGAIAVNIATTY
ncbi:MAG TPA: biopolymer transporter ExbD [Gammaproteobacteria bacterium]|nr:biopolymer transporter ExbD [Gammaproteobacteria bacterium]|tara:strand:+ start:2247 stop:2654 length:408 start_codon:yes stop_codon:yes gene_type:complete